LNQACSGLVYFERADHLADLGEQGAVGQFSSAVNNARHEGPDCAQLLTPAKLLTRHGCYQRGFSFAQSGRTV